MEISSDDSQGQQKYPSAENSSSSEDIRDLLVNIAQNPSNNRRLIELLDHLETYPLTVWENCLSESMLGTLKAQSSSVDVNANTVNYRALVAMLVPSYAYAWISWLRSLNNRQYAQNSLEFQEDIWESSRKNPKANDKLRTLIRIGISQLLCELIREDISDTDYQNIEWLIARQTRQNVWYSRFKSYTRDIFKYINDSFPKNLENPNDNFYALLTISIKELEKQGWSTTYPQYLKVAQLVEKYDYCELAAIFYQLSTGCVPGDVWNRTSKVDLDDIAETIPLKRESFLDKFIKRSDET